MSLTTASPATVARPTSHRRGNPWWTLACVALGVIMVGIDGSVVAIANPYIARSLHASLADLQWVTNATCWPWRSFWWPAASWATATAGGSST